MNAEPASAAVSTELKRRTLWAMSNRTEHSSCIRSLTAEQMENSRPRAELARVTMERDILGKATAYCVLRM
jgi:transposase